MDDLEVTVELLPCPFCGGEASDTGHTRYSRPLTDAWWNDGTPIAETFHVNCMSCGATSRSGITGGYQTKAEAITAWNTRSLSPASEAERGGEREWIERCARVAYPGPQYMGGNEVDERGQLPPGSPYDRGRYDAAAAIRALPVGEREMKRCPTCDATANESRLGAPCYQCVPPGAWFTLPLTPSTDTPAPIDDTALEYLLRYGPACRDCADEAGVCPASGMPCGGRKKATAFVLSALRYGLNNGFVDPVSLSAALSHPLLGEVREVLEPFELAHGSVASLGVSDPNWPDDMTLDCEDAMGFAEHTTIGALRRAHALLTKLRAANGGGAR